MWPPTQQNLMWHQNQDNSGTPIRVPYNIPAFGAGQSHPGSQNWPQNEQNFMLEHQFGQMSFNQPPPPMFQQPQQRLTNSSAQVLQRPNLAAQGGPPPTSGPGNGGIPSLLDIRVPVPAHLSNGYHQNRGPVRPPMPPQPRKISNFAFCNCLNFLDF